MDAASHGADLSDHWVDGEYFSREHKKTKNTRILADGLSVSDTDMDKMCLFDVIHDIPHCTPTFGSRQIKDDAITTTHYSHDVSLADHGGFFERSSVLERRW
jgi:hypothetical protein